VPVLRLARTFGFATLALSLCAPHAAAQQQVRPTRVLVLYQQQAETQSMVEFSQPLQRTIRQELGAPVDFYQESLDFDRFAGREQSPALADYLDEKYRRHGIDVVHPRYVVVPKVGTRLQPHSLARTMESAVEALLEQGWDFDVIDAHYFYPDGVAAAQVARRFSRPLVITARGSDINLIAQETGPRRLIQEAARQAAGVITVSAALKRELINLGIPGDLVEVIRNGVDTELFRPRDQACAREAFGLGSQPLVAAVGNLVPEKGHDLVLRAVARLDTAQVVIVGSGPEKQRLKTLARDLGLDDRARFMENMTQDKLAGLYSAADVLALGSTREGWPNVLLEAMACGTPVVASDVGGVREIVREEMVGKIVGRRSPEDFALALRSVLDQGSDRERVRSFASQFDWSSVARRYYFLLNKAVTSASDLPVG